MAGRAIYKGNKRYDSTMNSAIEISYNNAQALNLSGNPMLNSLTGQGAIDELAKMSLLRDLISNGFTSITSLLIPDGRWYVTPSNTNGPESSIYGFLEVVVRPATGNTAASRYLKLLTWDAREYFNFYNGSASTWSGWQKVSSDNWYVLTHSASTISAISEGTPTTIITGDATLMKAKAIGFDFCGYRGGQHIIERVGSGAHYATHSYVSASAYQLGVNFAVNFDTGLVQWGCSVNSWGFATVPVTIAANTIRYRL